MVVLPSLCLLELGSGISSILNIMLIPLLLGHESLICGGGNALYEGDVGFNAGEALHCTSYVLYTSVVSCLLCVKTLLSLLLCI
jgi:hypothetical protein